MGHPPYTTRGYDIEILLRAQTVCQVFSRWDCGTIALKFLYAKDAFDKLRVLLVHITEGGRDKYKRGCLG